MLTKLKLILWKSLLIRKRHWILTITEILIPILLFTLIAYGRSKISGMNKVEKDASFSEFVEIEDIDANLPVADFNLWYAPYTDFTEKIMKRVQEKFNIPGEAIKDFSSEKELREHFTKNSSHTIGAVIFRGNDRKKLNYDISFHHKHLEWNTDKHFMPIIAEEEISGSSKYLYSGFVALQIAVNNAFMEISLQKEQLDFRFSIQEFPYPPHTFDNGSNDLFMYFLPLVTIFSFVFLCPAVLKRVGEEKTSGAKEYLKLVGMNSSMIWFGWLIHALMSNMISIVAIVVLMKVPFWGVSYPPIEHSGGVVLFLFLFLYCMAAVTFCFLIATVINTPSVATITGILIWIFSYFIPQTIIASNENIRWLYKISFAISPNMGLYYGYSAVAMYEMREVGIQWYNIFESGSGGEDDITMGNVLLAFVFDSIFFMLLTLYIENVKPGKYGIAKPLFFPLLDLQDWIKSFSFGRTLSKVGSPLLPGEDYCIQIHNLKKRFYKNVAVDGLSMNIRKNCITMLLGHNGAGKTTTMSLLTGMISATEGRILVNGKDIRKHTNEVRKNLGLCTQHNLLFSDLTASEHLQFFGMLKGKKSKEIKKKAKKLLERFKIKPNSMPHQLSGGMKRKLCLAMALISDSEVLVLDEPTSGMDPESRREVWNMLLEIKSTKTIIISTHFMEEADVLGDQIAIMANGTLQCYGTALQLKNDFNTGYHLSVILDSKMREENKMLPQQIEREIKEVISGAQLLRENGDNAVYLLPLDKKVLYAQLFNKLEDNKSALGIESMGLSITTLNDVFLKAKAEIDAKDKSEVDAKDKSEDDGSSNSGEEHRSKLVSRMRRQTNIFRSLISKRWYFFKRKFFWYLPALIVAVTIFLVTLWLGTANTDYYSYGGPKLNLTLNVYGKTGVVFGGNTGSSSQLVSKMKQYYLNALLNEEGEPDQVEDVSQAIIKIGIENIAYYKRHMIVAAEFNTSSEDDKVIVNAMYSKSALHGLPISINLAMNAVLKSLLNDSFSISVSNAPLKPLYTDFAPSELSEINVGILWLIMVPTALLFLVSDFIIFPNTELSTKFVQIQNIAGVRIWFYWFANIVFDLILFICKLIVLVVAIVLMDLLAFDSTLFGISEIRTLIEIFAFYGVVALPFVYLFSYRKTICGGYTRLIMIGLFTGIVPTVIIRAMELSDDSHYMEIAKYVKHVLLCFSPQFGLNYVSVKFAQKYVKNFNWVHMNPNKKKHLCEVDPNPCCLGDDTLQCSNYRNYFKNDKLGIYNDLLEMLVSFFFYLVILCFINSTLCERIVHYIKYLTCCSCCDDTNEGLDGDNYENDKETKLYAKNLKKSFGMKHKIINGLELQLKKRKCFGLLGVNGAGKSTIFRMLTKGTFFDAGEIALSLTEKEEKKIKIDDDMYSEQIGYCPQENYLNFFLTGRELLLTIAVMRGYTWKYSLEISKDLLEQFGLKNYADKPCMEYSGGNKRKLSTCIAFLGQPHVIMLDEPTSGVDPASRRIFWNILSKTKSTMESEPSLLLCSHSIEECEALCDEIGIMKNGKISTQGTLSKLKNDHEKGYIIDFKLKQAADDRIVVLESFRSEIEEKLTNAKCTTKDAYSDSLKYHVDENATLSQLFSVMEELRAKHEGFIDDYVISQVSLEDIFLAVAKERDEENRSEQGKHRFSFRKVWKAKEPSNDSCVRLQKSTTTTDRENYLV